MATLQGQGHVPTQSQQGLIAGDQYVATSNQGLVNGSTDPDKSKKKLIIIGIIACVIIIAVIIAAVTIEFKGNDGLDGYSSPTWGWGDCGCSFWNTSFSHYRDEVCGMYPLQKKNL